MSLWIVFGSRRRGGGNRSSASDPAWSPWAFAVNSSILARYRSSQSSPVPPQRTQPPTLQPGSAGGELPPPTGGAGAPAAGEPCSFTPETLVETAQGEQPIASTQVGEQVQAYNSQTHQIELEPVLHVWRHRDQGQVKIQIWWSDSSSSPADREGRRTVIPSQSRQTKQGQSEALWTTPEHPFLATGASLFPRVS